LTLLSGTAIGGIGVPFLYDDGAHVRLLLSVALLIAAEVIVHKRIRVTVRQFLDRGIIAAEDQPEFERVIASAMRLRNSVVVELLLLAFAILGAYLIGQRHVSMNIATWYATPDGQTTQLTAAGYWYFFV